MNGPRLCPRCSGQLAPGAAFCRHCGAPVRAAEAGPASAPARVACPACEHTNPPGSRFCRACGTALAAPASREEPTRTDIGRAPSHVTPPPDPVVVSEPSRRRRLAAIVSIAALALAAGAAVAVAAVFLSHNTHAKKTASVPRTNPTGTGTGSTPTSTPTGTTPTTSTPTTGTNTSPTNPPPSTPAPGTTPASTPAYSTANFSAAPPAGWKMTEDAQWSGGYYESKWVGPGKNDALVDVTPGTTASPESSAAGVRSDLTKVSGYQEVSFGRAALPQGDSVQWVFKLPGVERVDYFFNGCHNGYAVLGSSSPGQFGQMLPTFQAFVASVKPKC